MKLLFAVGIAAAVFGWAATAHADLDAKDMEAFAEKLKSENAGALANLGTYPNLRSFTFEAGGGDYYRVDLRAQLCFRGTRSASIVLAPCKNLKKGYPLIAPLITWDE